MLPSAIRSLRRGVRPSVKAVARGIDAISKLMEPGQQTLQCGLDSCFSKQMLDRKDCPQRFMIAVSGPDYTT